jgi:MFS family permease
MHRPGPLAVLRRVLANPALRRVLFAYFAFHVAEFSTWVGILLYAYERTGPASVGFVALIQLVPASLVAAPAAMLGDRYPRHRVLAAGYLVQAVAMLATAVAMILDSPVWLIYGGAAVAASSLVVTRPTQSALLPSLSRAPEELTAANGAAGVVEGAGVLVGPLLAAAILTGSVVSTVFVMASGALILAALATVGLRPDADVGPLAVADSSAIGGDDDSSFLAGLRTVAADPDARLLVGLLTARMLMIGAADVLFVLMALDLLGMGEPGAGLLNASLGAGTILGGALTFALVGRGRLAVVAAVGAVAWGGSIALIGLTAVAAFAPPLIILGGAGLAIVDVSGRTMLQRSVRDEVLGRVFGLQEGLAMAGLAAGSILVPLVAGVVGLTGSILVVAAVLPVLAVLAWAKLAALDRRTVAPVRELALLRRTVVFGPLPAPQLESVARHATWSTVAAGTVIIREGDPGDRYYVLARGVVRVDQAGRWLRDLSTTGDGFGEIALLRGVPRTATVTATEETDLLAVDRADFLTAVTGHAATRAAADRVVATHDRSARSGAR